MNILCIGDVVGQCGVDLICSRLPWLKRSYNADLCILNGENADNSGRGITKSIADVLFSHGADVITTGNHALQQADEELYYENPYLIMPANFPLIEKRGGCCEVDFGAYSVFIANVSGNAYGGGLDNPFLKTEELLAQTNSRFKIIDFHGDSTAEKKAFAYYFDGKVSAIFGTHTHVQTADEQVLEHGTGYITDLGMTGCDKSVIGVTPQTAIKKQRLQRPSRFALATGKGSINGALFTLDDKTGLCINAERVRFCDE